MPSPPSEPCFVFLPGVRRPVREAPGVPPRTLVPGQRRGLEQLVRQPIQCRHDPRGKVGTLVPELVPLDVRASLHRSSEDVSVLTVGLSPLGQHFARDKPYRTECALVGVQGHEEQVEIGARPEGASTDVCVERPLADGARAERAALDLYRESGGRIAPVEDQIHSLIVNEARGDV